MIFFAIMMFYLIPFSTLACPEAFEPESHGKNTIRNKIEQYKDSPEHPELGRFIGKLSSLEIMENLSSFSPEHAKFFTAEQLRPKYSEIAPRSDGVMPKNYSLKAYTAQNKLTGLDRYGSKRDFYGDRKPKSGLVHLPVERVRELNKNSHSYKAYGPLPHLPPAFIPHLNPKVLTGLGRSIIYLSDKLQYLTTRHIQALAVEQIRILAMPLLNTGKHTELSRRQVIAVLKKYPQLYKKILRISEHNDVLVGILLGNIKNRRFPFSNIPLDVVNFVPINEFSLEFLQALRRRSYVHFKAISPQKISNMDFVLQEYIVLERWQSFLREPQKELKFRDLTVEKVKQMSTEDRQKVLEMMNLSEENFMNVLDRS